MIIDPNDPRLTAYALGELDIEQIAEIELLLAESPEARQSVEEIRRVSQQVTAAYAAEPRVGVSPQHRYPIEGWIDPTRAGGNHDPRGPPGRAWSSAATFAKMLRAVRDVRFGLCFLTIEGRVRVSHETTHPDLVITLTGVLQ